MGPRFSSLLLSPLPFSNLLVSNRIQGWRTLEDDQIDQVTSWPSSLAVASTWSVDRIYEYAATMADEFVAKGANVKPRLSLQ